MKEYAEKFKKDIASFHDITRQFYDKKLSVAEYKHFSGGFGSYAQRGGERGMLRLRLGGGRITKDSLRFITESIQKYEIDRIHLTTCQTVQLHNLTADTICTLIEEAWDHGIITRGGGGDYPRNVMMSPLSGVTPDEPFDLTGYVDAAAHYLLGFIDKVKLPRKLKVCFSSTPDDAPHATFRDLGFVANEDHTFDVYAAGGLGNNPKMGVCVAEHIAPDMILYYIKAMVDTFTTYGNYENRGRSRTRYLQDTLGAEGFAQAFHEKLKSALQEEDLKISVKPFTVTKKGDGSISHPRILTQKQPGLYTVSYHPIGGNPTPEFLQKLYDTILPMDEIEIRLSPDEGMYLINCTAEEAETLLALTEDGAKTLFETSTACIGNRICQLGLRDSQTLLKACVDAVRPCGFADGVLPKIRISGCPSSCSAHQVAALGFRGAVKQTPDGPKAAYAIFEGGCDTLGEETFGADLIVMTEENIPKFLVELGKTIEAAEMTYDVWIRDHRKDLALLAEKYGK